MKLYEINSEIERLLNQVDPETGEMPDGILDVLNDLEIEKEQKVLDIACYMKGLLAEAEMLKAEADKLMTRKRNLETHASRLKDYIRCNVAEGVKVQDARSVISWRKSSGVVVTDETMLPEECFKTVRSLSLSEVGNRLKAGEVLHGAFIEERQNIQIK